MVRLGWLVRYRRRRWEHVLCNYILLSLMVLTVVTVIMTPKRRICKVSAASEVVSYVVHTLKGNISPDKTVAYCFQYFLKFLMKKKTYVIY